MKSRRSRTASLACAGALFLFGSAPWQPAAGQGTATSTTTSSLELGAVYTTYTWFSTTIGPGSVVTGTLSGCTLVGVPPFAGCASGGGSGTLADPFFFSCSSPLPLAGCSGGTTVNVLAGESNTDLHTHRVAPTGTTSTVTSSIEVGGSDAIYVWATESIGPGTIMTGTLAGCALVGSPPFAGCSLDTGTGTSADPFEYSCSGAPPLAGCSGGSPFVVLAGTSNIDSRTHRVSSTGNTFTYSFSSQQGALNARYLWISEAIGPMSIVIGSLSGCTLVGSPPFAGCNPHGGSGTVDDPFVFGCSAPLPLAGCTGGVPYTVFAEFVNLDIRTHTVVAAGAATAAVPIGPWVPIGSAVGVLLASLLIRRAHASRRS